MGGSRPKICAAVVSGDLAAIKRVGPLVDFFEVRIDLIGAGWREVTGRLKKPWIACNRRAEEGGKWRDGERKRIAKLLSALELGASVIDVELATPGVVKVVKEIKGRAECLLSYHNTNETPSLKTLKDVLKNEISLGADICKVVTTALSLDDDLTVLQLIKEFPQTRVVAFAMGEAGQMSRVLCPLVGGYFTYASIEAGKESAEGQLTVGELRKIYRMLEI